MAILDDDSIGELLAGVATVAIVGVSPDRSRPSHGVAEYLRDATDWTLWFVNPRAEQVLGQPCYPSLHDLPATPDLVDVFRRREHLSAVVDDAIDIGAGGVWFQLGLRDDDAAQRAAAAGLAVVQNRCLKVEHTRRQI